MRLGIKLGLKNAGLLDQADLSFTACEIHFDLARCLEYSTLFANERLQNLEYRGLHFWAVLSDGTLPTYAVRQPEVRAETLSLLRQAIHVSAEYGFDYLLFHPGPRCICKLSLSTGQFSASNQCTSVEESRDLFLNHSLELRDYARSQGVNLIIETETKRKPTFWFRESDYGPIQLAGDQDLETLALLGQAGCRLCFDTAHVTTWFGEHARSREELFTNLTTALSELMPYIDVVHAASILPPYLIDTTSGFTPSELADNVFPNINEIAHLLCSLPSDTTLIPEPRLYDHAYHNQLFYRILRTDYTERKRQ